jgi:drug/metabolite transporter (DMT)-like permease
VRPVDFLQLLIMAALWGASYLFLRVATPEFGPIPVIAVRVSLAAAVLLPVFLLRQDWRAEFRSHFWRLCVLGILNGAIPFPLFAYATLHITAGFAAVINSTAPLFAAVLAWIWLRDRPTPGAVLGLLVGIGGVAVLVGGISEAGPGAGLAVLACLGASLSYGLSAAFVKRKLSGISAWVSTIGSFGLAGLILSPFTVALWPDTPPSGGAWLAVISLALACTSLPNIFYFRMVLRVGPARAMTVAFLIPVFGMLWGVIFLDETVTMRMLAGCAVILLGTSLVTGLVGRRLGGGGAPLSR